MAKPLGSFRVGDKLAKVGTSSIFTVTRLPSGKIVKSLDRSVHEKALKSAEKILKNWKIKLDRD